MTGEKLRISTKHEIIKPNTVKRIQGYGLPLPREITRKGDLLVAFDIKFPSVLTPTEKELLADMLPDVWEMFTNKTKKSKGITVS